LWWSYFSRAKSQLDHALAAARGAAQSMMGRDVGSLAHFPMLCGVIAYALAVGDAISHPAAPLLVQSRVALAAGIVLFVGGMGVALLRATGRLPLPRMLLAAVAGVAVAVVAGVGAWLSFAIALVAVGIIGALEEREVPSTTTRAPPAGARE
jgi:low temperature requirement protein LtrA